MPLSPALTCGINGGIYDISTAPIYYSLFSLRLSLSLSQSFFSPSFSFSSSIFSSFSFISYLSVSSFILLFSWHFLQALDSDCFEFFSGKRQTQHVLVLNDCSIRIPCGQFWMLLGPNGCGKSTLLKVFSTVLVIFFCFFFRCVFFYVHC